MRVIITDRDGVKRERLINPSNLAMFKKKYRGRIEVKTYSWADQVRKNRLQSQSTQKNVLRSFSELKNSEAFNQLVSELERGDIVLPFGS